jgi:hypothetical protein
MISLSSALRALLNLQTVRIDTGDRPEYPDGWLRAHDANVLDRMYLHEFDLSAEKSLGRKPCGAATYVSTFYTHNIISAHRIIDALIQANTDVQDLRAMHCDRLRTFFSSLTCFTLQTLRVTVPYSYATRVNEILPICPLEHLASLFSSMTSLKHFTIASSENATHRETCIFLDALSNHTKIQRIRFLDYWALYEDTEVSGDDSGKLKNIGDTAVHREVKVAWKFREYRSGILQFWFSAFVSL